ncbi:CHC2 zinc finger domain-containing protein, partial [Lonsdalea populi]|uniref:CHC2 zinc finger domain-containing protein n=1 Tax=Lonsdalea populi TaxID=1172565 RepID=UPI0011BF78E6
MARIAESELQHLKAAVSLVAIAEQQGRKLVKRGKDYVTLCPFHQEKTPSMVISPDKNLYHCFGCNAGGSVLDWVMKTEGVSLPHAVDKLRRELGSVPAAETLPPVADIADEQERQSLLGRVVEFYHHTLLNAPEAVAYLEKRGLNHPELVTQFRLGFANRTLAYRLPPKKLKDGAAIRGQLQALGIMRSSGHEHLAGSLVVPVIDMNGQVRELYGRKVSTELRKGTLLHLYLPGPHGGVWNEQTFVAGKTVILCESLIDAMSFWVAGYRNVTAAYGVNGVTDEMRQAFIRHGVKQVLIAFDNDAAGDEGAVKLASALVADGITPFRVVFPAGMDANEYLRKVSEPEQAFRAAVEGAMAMGEAVSAEPESVPQRKAAPQPEKTSQPATSLAAGVVAEVLPNGELEIALSGQQWRLRGVTQIKPGSGVMKVNAQLLDTQSGAVFADGVELMSARSRAGYARMAATELGLGESEVKRSLGRVLLALESHLNQPAVESVAPEVSDEAKAEALALLQSPELITRIGNDLAACGVVGESTNLIAGYLAAVSRKLEKPLAVLIQSSSAAGKSSLMDAVLNLIPPEERLQYSAMTGQSLFYLGESNLQHKILAIAEEEGVRQAA